MWIGVIPTEQLNAAGRWTVAFFASETVSNLSAYPMATLRSLVRESKAAVDPKGLSDTPINYLGLENVRSLTGELVEFRRRPATEIKSRSKTYEKGDVLFGRLRPELNKVYLAEGEVSPGICSNEFIVLQAQPELIDARYLRYILASPFIAQFASKLRTGASLPRMSSGDLLDLSIPIPPMEVQLKVSSTLEDLDRELRHLRRKVEWLSGAIVDGVTETVRLGTDRVAAVQRRLDEVS